MVIFVESPWPILFIGIAVEAVLAFLLLQTGRGKFLIAMIGVAAFVVAGLIVEQFVVTDRKAVTQTLDAAVAAVRRNDLNGVLDCISPSAKEPRSLTRWVLGRVEVREAHISDLEIKVNRLTSPPTAEAKFLAVGRGRRPQGRMALPGLRPARDVQLRLEGGRWLVTGYEFARTSIRRSYETPAQRGDSDRAGRVRRRLLRDADAERL